MQHNVEKAMRARATAPTETPTAILPPVERPAQRWAAVLGGGAERTRSMVELPLKEVLAFVKDPVGLFQ